MRGPRRWSAILLMCFLQLSSTKGRDREAQSSDGKDRNRRKRQRRVTEADEDAAFAAEMLGLVYDRVRDVGDALRVVGDTAGGLAGGSFKLISASVNGLSSVLDAASREVKSNVRAGNEPPLTPSSKPSVAATSGHTSEDTRSSDAGPGAAGGKQAGSSSGRSGGGEGRDGPDPFDRIGGVALNTLAGSLKLLSTAVGGVGDAVFQAGILAEGLAGGTGQVAEDTVRLVQRFVGWARDDIAKLNKKGHDPDSSNSLDISRPGTRPATTSTSPPETSADNDVDFAEASPSPGALPPSLTVLEAWEGLRNLCRYAIEAAVREAVTLFRRKNGALPPAPRMAVLMVLVLFVYGRRRHEEAAPPSPPAAVRTPRRNSEPPRDFLARERLNRGLPPGTAAPAMAAMAAMARLYSPSRSLFPPEAPQTPSSGAIDSPNATIGDIDPSLPSPAQDRAAQMRAGQAGGSGVRGSGRYDGRVRGADRRGETAQRRGGVWGARIFWLWGWAWGRLRGWARFREPRSAGGGGDGDGRRRYLLWLVLLWLAASVLEGRERDRLAWLSWDEGYRRGQGSRTVDPAVEAETAAWLNHILASAWGGTGKASPGAKLGASDVTGVRDSNGCSHTGIFASDGLSSFVAEHLTEGLLEALEEMKPTSVVGIELLDVELGSSPPRVLGIKMLDPDSSASPGWGDGRCRREGECVSLRVDVEMATQDLRVGVRVKASTLEKALLPTGTVRLLELFLRGSVSVRAELRDEFPFVSTALVAFDSPPDVQVRLEQWGLDALTLGAVPAVVDEWARIALQQALAPYVLPGHMEVDAAHALCPDCPAVVPAASRTTKEKPGGGSADPPLPSIRLPASAAAREAVGGSSSRMRVGKKDISADKGRRLGNKAGSSSNDGDRKHARPSVHDGSSSSSPLLTGAGGAASRLGAAADDGNAKCGVIGGQKAIGRAATMADLNENRSGKGWFKRLTSEHRGDERMAMDWEGMD